MDEQQQQQQKPPPPQAQEEAKEGSDDKAVTQTQNVPATATTTASDPAPPNAAAADEASAAKPSTTSETNDANKDDPSTSGAATTTSAVESNKPDPPAAATAAAASSSNDNSADKMEVDTQAKSNDDRDKTPEAEQSQEESDKMPGAERKKDDDPDKMQVDDNKKSDDNVDPGNMPAEDKNDQPDKVSVEKETSKEAARYTTALPAAVTTAATPDAVMSSPQKIGKAKDDKMDVDGVPNEGAEKEPSTTTAATAGSGRDRVTLKPADVLLGRPSVQHRRQEGNKSFWDFVMTVLPQFSNTVGDVSAQLKLAQKVVDHIEQEKGGRFLVVKGDDFTVAPREEALAKVRRGMKEKWEREQYKKPKTKSRDAKMAEEKSDDKPVRHRAAKNPPPKSNAKSIDDENTAENQKAQAAAGIKPMDVLIGKAFTTRKGNQLYWNRLMGLMPRFAEVVGDKEAQLELAQELVDYVEKEKGGRFFEADGQGRWYVGDKDIILGKVRRAIKEKWERTAKKGELPASLVTKSKKSKKAQDTSTNRAKRAKVATKKRPIATPDYTVQLTHSIVDLLKAEQKPLSMKTITRRLDAETEDAEGVCRSLAELGMIHEIKEEERRKGEKNVVTKFVWWEHAASYLKEQSWEVMPISEDTEHAMRSEMSLLVREEAKLDAWISRLRNLRVMPQEREREHLFVTSNDVRHALLPEDRNDTAVQSPRKKKAKKLPTLAVHAPFGTVFQSSTPVSYQRDKSSTKTRQVLFSCKASGEGEHGDYFGPAQDNRKEIKVYFLPRSDQESTQLLQDNPVLRWIQEPSYTSETNGMGGAGDNLHVSCLKEDEGVSSFF